MGRWLRILQFHLWGSIIKAVDEAPLTAEDKTRFYHYSVFLVVGLPAMIVFGISNLYLKNYLLASIIMCSAMGLAFGWILLRKLKSIVLIYRINSFLVSILLLYMLQIGGDAGSKILWMYASPLVAFFMFGKKEGLTWTIMVFSVAQALLWIPQSLLPVYEYVYDFKIRFTVTFVIVAFVTYWFEFFRQRYFLGMEAEKGKLEKEKQKLQEQIQERIKTEKEKEELILKLQETLDMVKKLSGLVPICASCHKIRDDQGYWNQLETYIQQYSDVEFSHGLCPDCAKSLYPTLNSNQSPENKK